MLRVCIASIQNVERSLLLLVVSASDIPLRTIKLFLFSSLRRIRPCCRPSQTNIRWCVADCDLYCMVVGNCFCHFVVRTSSNRSIAVVRDRLCHIHSFVVGKCFWHFAPPAIFYSQLLDQNRDSCLYSTCIRRPR